MSHGDHSYHRKTYALIRGIAEDLKQPIGILADLCGPKIRTGKFKKDSIELKNNDSVIVTTRNVEGKPGLIPSQYAKLANDVKPGDRILLADGIGIGFGLGHGTSFSESKATINVDRTRDGQNLISTFDPENVFENIRVFSETGKCTESSQTKCMIFTIFHTFREPLEFNMVATYVWDFNNNAWQNYYNHGIHIIGDSLNPPKTKSVAFGTYDMRGLFTLTQIDKFEDKWIDEFGNIYKHKGNDRFDKISTISKKVIYDYTSLHGCDRLCNWFESYKLNQELLAKIELEKMINGKYISNEQADFIPPAPYTKIPRSEDIDLQNKIVDEIVKATKIFEESFDVKNNF